MGAGRTARTADPGRRTREGDDLSKSTDDPRLLASPPGVPSPEDAIPDQMAEAVIDISNVLGDEAAAVLLVDLRLRSVVHVNSIAQQLAPDVELPARVDAWSDSAELTDLDGGRLSDTDHPLSRIARAESVPGQAISAARSSDMGRERLPLWVIGLPMQGAPVLEGYALVVMLPMRLRNMAQKARDAGAVHADLRSRAVLATGLSFTVADAKDPDLPLVWVNPAFTAVTGYTLEESVGRNCRFLQGPSTNPEEPARIRAALQQGRAITTTLLNYRKDGSAYWNQLNVSPVRGPGGELTHFVGIQTDVSGRIESDRARDAALESERTARAAAESAEQRLQLMADASNRLSGTLDASEGRRRLVELLVPRVADYVVVVQVDEVGRISDIASEHADPAQRDRLAELASALPGAIRQGPALDVLLGPGRGRLLRDLDTDTPALGPGAAGGTGGARGIAGTPGGHTTEDRYLEIADALDTRSALLVPLEGRDNPSDVLIMGRGSERAQFDHADLEVAHDLGRRAGLILENARLYETQRHNSEVLQRSLLPELPVLRGIRSAARYHAGSVGAEVGGDFYELTGIDGGSTVALSVGDVIGHDMLAAAAMGHLKGLLRACVHDPGATPASVLQRVDGLLDGLQMQTIASMLQAFMRPVDGAWEITWSSGGHPPLAVRYPDGRTGLLEVGGAAHTNDPLIGLTPGLRRDHVATVPAGSVVVGYTDGLVERRGESLDLGLHRLLHQLGSAPADPSGLVEHLVESLTIRSDHDDDVAIVAVILDGVPA